MRKIRYVMLVLLVLLAGIGLWEQRHAPGGGAEAPARAETGGIATPAPSLPSSSQPPASTPPANPAADDDLPPEARATLALIAAGGPFPYERDGLEFRNFERRLPHRPRGWYHEYTVPTPGLDHRGPRRIVTGGNPPQAWYYTDDHYETFREIAGKP